MQLTDPLNYAAPRLDTWVSVISSNVVLSTATTFANVTGLTVALTSGKKYAFECHLFHVSSGTTNGAQFGVNIGAAPTVLVVGNHSGVTNAVVTGVVSLGTTTARDTAITAQTTGSANLTHTIIAGYIQPSADGTFAIRATPELSANLTINIGSWLHVRECEN